MVNRGFTLLEVVVAIAILAVIMAIVYSSFSSVTRSIDATRRTVAEVRARRFLARSFNNNFGSVCVDDEYVQSVYQFLGTDEEGIDGPADTVVFCSSSTAMGGFSLPGDLKQVRYELLAGGAADTMFDAEDRPEEREEQEEEHPGNSLRAMETPLLGAMVEELDEESGDYVAAMDVEAPSWTLEDIRSLDFKYYDGAEEKWRDEWDSLEMGRLPWCVHIRINFAKPEDVLEAEWLAGFDDEEDPDFQCVVPIPQGIGVKQPLGVGAAEPGEEETSRETRQ